MNDDRAKAVVIAMLGVWIIALSSAAFIWVGKIARPADSLTLTSPNGQHRVTITAGDDGSTLKMTGKDGKTRTLHADDIAPDGQEVKDDGRGL